MNVVHLCDCMDFMKGIPDRHYQLAIVDPPYGNGGGSAWAGKRQGRFGGIFDRYRTAPDDTRSCRASGGTWAKRYRVAGDRQANIASWDHAPGQDYFDELFRISENQIIWGGNYFGLPPTRCFVVWRKLTISESFSMAMAEYAWCSFDSNAKVFEAAPQGTRRNPRIHPTQKPVSLYKWLLGRYAKPGDLIFDSHVGSGSSRIACWDMGFDFEGCEISRTYWQGQEDRFRKHLGEEPRVA